MGILRKNVADLTGLAEVHFTELVMHLKLLTVMLAAAVVWLSLAVVAVIVNTIFFSGKVCVTIQRALEKGAPPADRQPVVVLTLLGEMVAL